MLRFSLRMIIIYYENGSKMVKKNKSRYNYKSAFIITLQWYVVCMAVIVSMLLCDTT